LTIRYLCDEQWKTIDITLKQIYILYFSNNVKWTIGYVYTETNYKYIKTKENIFEVITDLFQNKIKMLPKYITIINNKV